MNIDRAMALSLSVGLAAGVGVNRGTHEISQTALARDFENEAKVSACLGELGNTAIRSSSIPKPCEPFVASFPFKESIVRVYTPDKNSLLKSYDGAEPDEGGSFDDSGSGRVYELSDQETFQDNVAYNQEKANIINQSLEIGVGLFAFLAVTAAMSSILSRRSVPRRAPRLYRV